MHAHLAGSMHLHLLYAAMRLLSQRAHSRGELEAKLLRLASRRKGILSGLAAEEGPAWQGGGGGGEGSVPTPRSLTRSVLQELEAKGLLNDAEYAAWHVAQRAAHRPRSRAQISAELRIKRVGGSAVEAALSSHSELAACAACALRRPSMSSVDLRKQLLNKAFARSTVAQVLAARAQGGSAHLLSLAESAQAEAAEAGAGAGAGVGMGGLEGFEEEEELELGILEEPLQPPLR